MALKKADDHHWDFLEEIEAPMWVDLTVESNTFKQDSNDKWFLLSHPFHQCSSRQLKFAFLHSSKGIGNSNFDLQGPSSPKLPSSVSRSRGKHYRSRKWESGNTSLLSSNGHAIEKLGGKTLKAGSRSIQEMKLKSSCNILKGYSSSVSSKDPEISSTESTITNNFKPKSSCNVLKGYSSSMISKDHESTSTESTITNNSKTISSRDDLRKSLHAGAIKVGESTSTSGLLSDLRITLRKSCVTRQAARVEINDGRHAIGRKSSSSKSSVGSSSSLGYDVTDKELTRREKADRTPDSRYAAGICHAANNREKTNISRASNDQRASRISYCTNPKGGKIVIANSARLETVKAKLIYQPTNRKALVPLRANEGSTSAAIKASNKLQVSRLNRCLAGDKENGLGKKAVVQECGGRNIAAEGMATGKRMKQSELRKFGRTGLVGSKEKASDQIEGKFSRKVSQKVYLR